jgi:hypothetical protein
MNKEEFKKELERLINRYCMENGSDTPDFILSEYLTDCLESYDDAVKAREKWYGRKIKEISIDDIVGPPSLL